MDQQTLACLAIAAGIVLLALVVIVVGRSENRRYTQAIRKADAVREAKARDAVERGGEWR